MNLRQKIAKKTVATAKSITEFKSTDEEYKRAYQEYQIIRALSLPQDASPLERASWNYTHDATRLAFQKCEDILMGAKL